MGETPLAVSLLPLFRKALANRGMMTKFAKPATQMNERPGRNIWARVLSRIHILLVFGFSLVSSAQQLCTLRVNINDVFFGDCAQVSGRFGWVFLNESRD